MNASFAVFILERQGRARDFRADPAVMASEHSKNDLIYTANGVAFRYLEEHVVDCVHRWSVFTMYWPQLAFCALIGKE